MLGHTAVLGEATLFRVVSGNQPSTRHLGADTPGQRRAALKQQTPSVSLLAHKNWVLPL